MGKQSEEGVGVGWVDDLWVYSQRKALRGL